MAATNEFLTVVEKCRISPPPNTVGERSLPLTFFDLGWLLAHPIHQLFFYEFPHSKSHFIATVIPNLKHSLSITLQHFFPFSGNLIVFPAPNPSDLPRKPEIRYTEGDSIALTFAECSLDFNDLKGNHARECDKFYPLVPLLEGASKVSDFVKIPIFSVQVTIFPNSGIAIGLTNHHTLSDARSRYDLLKAWTSIAKYGTDKLFLTGESLPFYDRVIEYPDSLDEMCLKLPPFRTLYENYRPHQLVSETDKVRATFILTRAQINLLKKWLLVQLQDLEYVSSFTLGCAFIWSCIAKSRFLFEGKKGDENEEVERFVCVIDWRSRMDPPLPQTYFGNCVGPCFTTINSAILAGNKGFVTAVELVGKTIRETVKNKQGMLKDAETWLDKLFMKVPTVGVAGTPKINVYDLDFGWGKPKKYETISIDYGQAISVNVSTESAEDLEFGLSLPAKQMDLFSTIYGQELEKIVSEEI
uniref:Flavonoid acyltransferase n=1 Tax=Centaurea cyanus TaxID=41522 RepID=A0A6H2AB80_CENCY|nr:flavonoid acyltransferase [Centaurea cyanus]